MCTSGMVSIDQNVVDFRGNCSIEVLHIYIETSLICVGSLVQTGLQASHRVYFITLSRYLLRVFTVPTLLIQSCC